MGTPFACDLTAMSAEEQSRYRELVTRMKDGADHAEAVPGGIAIRFPVDRTVELAQFAALERKCCPFLDIAIALPAGGEHVELRMTGEPGVEVFLEAELASLTGDAIPNA